MVVVWLLNICMSFVFNRWKSNATFCIMNKSAVCYPPAYGPSFGLISATLWSQLPDAGEIAAERNAFRLDFNI